MYEAAGQPAVAMLTYIVCTKRINTRAFMARGNTFENPPPGTIIDTVVTLPER
jgi:aubergine-like protein